MVMLVGAQRRELPNPLTMLFEKEDMHSDILKTRILWRNFCPAKIVVQPEKSGWNPLIGSSGLTKRFYTTACSFAQRPCMFGLPVICALHERLSSAATRPHSSLVVGLKSPCLHSLHVAVTQRLAKASFSRIQCCPDFLLTPPWQSRAVHAAASGRRPRR